MDPLPRKVTAPCEPGRHCGVSVPPACTRLTSAGAVLKQVRGGGIAKQNYCQALRRGMGQRPSLTCRKLGLSRRQAQRDDDRAPELVTPRLGRLPVLVLGRRHRQLRGVQRLSVWRFAASPLGKTSSSGPGDSPNSRSNIRRPCSGSLARDHELGTSTSTCWTSGLGGRLGPIDLYRRRSSTSARGHGTAGTSTLCPQIHWHDRNCEVCKNPANKR